MEKETKKTGDIPPNISYTIKILFLLFEITLILFLMTININSTNISSIEDKPIAVMIGNSPDERAVQKGLKSACVIYEIEVEFPFNRYMAIFLENAETVAGPVRSSRYYFSRICAEWAAIFAHCGGQHLKNSNVLDINEIHNQFPFRRDDKIGGWINLFTSTDRLKQEAKKYPEYAIDNQDNHHILNFREYDNINGVPISKISIKYHKDYIISYDYHEDENKYYRFINQKPHIDHGNNEQIEVSNIIIQYAPIDLIDGDDQGRINVELIGEGIGRVFNGGNYQSVRWMKKTKVDQTLFLDSNNEPITYDKGVTWIHILSPYSEMWFK